MKQNTITGFIAAITMAAGMYMGYEAGNSVNKINGISEIAKYDILCPVPIGTENTKRPFRGFEDRILNTEGGNKVTLRKVFNVAFDSSKGLEGNFAEIEGLVLENEDIITSNGSRFKYVNTHDCPRYELQK